MNFDDLTPLQQKLFQGWQNKMPHVTIEEHMSMIMESHKDVCYHEAGHAAFHDYDGNNLRGISCIPNNDQMGTITYEQLLSDESVLNALGRGGIEMRIIFSLAGPVAQNMNAGKDWDIISAIEEVSVFCDKGEWESTDEANAYRLAKMISNRTWPPHRVLQKCERWTREILAIPEVWAVVKELAEKLYKEGEIQDLEEVKDIVSPASYILIKSAKWRRIFSTDVKIIPDI